MNTKNHKLLNLCLAVCCGLLLTACPEPDNTNSDKPSDKKTTEKPGKTSPSKSVPLVPTKEEACVFKDFKAKVDNKLYPHALSGLPDACWYC